MEGVALVTVWTANIDEKPLAVTIPCRDAGAAFGTVQALIVQAYASAHPDRPTLRFYPDGSYVATDAARELVFHADQKVDEVLTQCGRYNVIHVLDIQSLAATRNDNQEDTDVPLRNPTAQPQQTPSQPTTTTSTSSMATRTHAPRTTIRCTNDGCWLSAKDIVCDALSLWGVHSALPQNTVRRMKENHPDMFVKRALAGGGAHAPVIDTDQVALFCERCAEGMASDNAKAMRDYARSTRCAQSIAHIIERRARHAHPSGNTPPVRVRIRSGPAARSLTRSPPGSLVPLASSSSSSSLSRSAATLCSPLASSSAATALCAPRVARSAPTSPGSPSSVSNDSENLLPEDGWSNDGGCSPCQEMAPTPPGHLASRPNDTTSRDLVESPPAKSRRRPRRSDDTTDEEDSGERGVAANGDDGATTRRPTKRRRRTSSAASPAMAETVAAEQTHDGTVAARLMRRCARDAAADGTRSLCVWRWGADRRWRLVAEVRCTPAGTGAPWEVVCEAPSTGTNASGVTPAWIDARDLETLIRRAIESPCDLVAVGDSRSMPSLDAFYTDDGGRHEDMSLPGATEVPTVVEPGTVASALDGWLASACRRWVRAPQDRSKGLGLFRRAVAFGVPAADTPYGPYWACLVEDMQNALA
ncbi:hypothetical protein pqer_cds_70 [Pandoravirus quercus]|uniref:Uncharacterized protein n=1 Tax=Pandoravirus quercus TaxID=2107709 RepID=A0A2U7U7U3_9VIRU|nr:hypothetical protein pqer_cds_70 [Pandoravirus quercus]AVK74492.1 hypothetical protein pqer_cds_70 [Pandoravirus quercus]